MAKPIITRFLSFHYSFLLQIAGKLNSTIKEQQLKDVGQLEQDLVFGDAGTKELINFFRTHLVMAIWTNYWNILPVCI